MCPMTLLRYSRIRLLLRVVTKAPSIMRTLILSTADSTTSWANAVSHDLAWLATVGMQISCLPTCLSQWWEAMKDAPQEFARSTASLCNSSFANIHIQWATCNSLRELGMNFPCGFCAANFPTRQQRAVHMYRTHGIKSVERCL
eukprot:7827662-Karenia_brevis.AAC.1